MRQMIHDDSWVISTACPEALNLIPVFSHDEVKPEDVEKTADKSDDVADALRYGSIRTSCRIWDAGEDEPQP